MEAAGSAGDGGRSVEPTRRPDLRRLRSVRWHDLEAARRLAGHADVRWHLWIVLALLGRLDLALVAYAAYFPLRALGGGIEEGGGPCLSLASAVLVVARDEERNLAGCLDSARFADERVVVVDAASRDDTLEIARATGRRRLGPRLRRLRRPAERRRSSWPRATGSSRSTPTSGSRPSWPPRSARRLADPEPHCVGFRVPIRSEILGRPFGYSGTQHDLPLRLFRRDRGRWTGLVHETVELEGPIGRLRHVLEHRTLPDIRVFLGKIDHYTTLEARDLHQAGTAVPDERPGPPAVLDLPQALPRQAGLPRRPRGLHVLRALGALGGGPDAGSTASSDLAGGRIMISTHEAEVASRFDALHGRFKASLAGDDYRLRGIVEALGPVEGLRILDLGCGKGRFARALAGSRAPGRRARPLGGDAGRGDGRRPRPRHGPAASLSGHGAFDAVIAVEVFEHLDRGRATRVLDEARRVLRPGGSPGDRGQERRLAERARGPGCRAWRSSGSTSTAGAGCIPPAARSASAGSGPAGCRPSCGRWFEDVRVVHLLSPAEERTWLFRRVPAARLMTLWVASGPGRSP